LVLLLSTLGAAQASVSSAQTGFYGNHIAALLYRHAVDRADTHGDPATSRQAADPETFGLLSASRAELHSAWTMRPAAAHSAALFAATSFAR